MGFQIISFHLLITARRFTFFVDYGDPEVSRAWTLLERKAGDAILCVSNNHFLLGIPRNSSSWNLMLYSQLQYMVYGSLTVFNFFLCGHGHRNLFVRSRRDTKPKSCSCFQTGGKNQANMYGIALNRAGIVFPFLDTVQFEEQIRQRRSEVCTELQLPPTSSPKI